MCGVNGFTATGACAWKIMVRLGPRLPEFPGHMTATFTLQKRVSLSDS